MLLIIGFFELKVYAIITIILNINEIKYIFSQYDLSF